MDGRDKRGRDDVGAVAAKASFRVMAGLVPAIYVFPVYVFLR